MTKEEKLAKRKELFNKTFNENDLKICRICKQVKPLKEFSRNYFTVDFTRNECRVCTNLDYKERTKNKALSGVDHSKEWKNIKTIIPPITCGYASNCVDATDYAIHA